MGDQGVLQAFHDEVDPRAAEAFSEGGVVFGIDRAKRSGKGALVAGQANFVNRKAGGFVDGQEARCRKSGGFALQANVWAGLLLFAQRAFALLLAQNFLRGAGLGPKRRGLREREWG